MKLRTLPRVATWFLNQFGADPENESAIGDLFEKYHRSPGTTQYWRQVLAIVFGGLYREFRNKKFYFFASLLRIWLISVGLDIAAGLFLMWWYRFIHGYSSGHVLNANAYPLLTLRVVLGNHLPDQWDVSLLSVLLNILLPILVGLVIASSSAIHPRALLLTYTTLFISVTSLVAVGNIRMLVENKPNATGYLTVSLIALPMVPTLMVIGAGLSRNKSKEPLLEEDA
jgi:hypothetical protein